VGEEPGVLVGHFHEPGDTETFDLTDRRQDIVEPTAEFLFPVRVQQPVVAVNLEVAGQRLENDHADVVTGGI